VGNVVLNAKTISPIFAEVWRYLCEQVVPFQRNLDWDRIRIEFWSETGKIVIYPYKPLAKSGDVTGVIEVKSYWLEDFVCERIHSDAPIEKIEAEIKTLESRIAAEIADAALEVNIPILLGRSMVRVVFCMPNDDEPFADTTLHEQEFNN